MPHTHSSKWIWISSAIFGLITGLVKTIVFPYPEYNPPAIYPAIIAFPTTALFWSWLISRSNRPSLVRGGLVGAIVGLLTPSLIWPFFLLEVGLAENRVSELLGWSLVYMFLTPLRIGWLTILLGVAIGVTVPYAQRKATLGAMKVC